MRGLAALAVAIFHLSNPLVPGGYLAVDFFFALSGFVLDRTYRPRFAVGLGTGEFLAWRFVRLWPLHLCGLLLCFGWLAMLVARDATDIGWGTLLSGLAANLLFLPSVIGRDISPINPPAWSLLMEFGANALMALFAIRRPTRALMAMLCVFAAVLVVDLTVTQALTPFAENASIVKQGYRWHDVHLGVVRTIFSFLAGMVLSRLLEGRVPNVSRWSLAVLVLGLVPLLLPFSGWSRFMLDLGFILLLSPALVLAGARLEMPRTFLRWGERLGDISYPLYAVHFFWTYVVGNYGYDHDWPLGLTLSVFLLTAIGSAAFLARFVDAPLRRWLGRHLGVFLAQK
ncbi:acyltransferase family protein [Novosphingobium terrae]|uniref:acyltransferase family protein n=1 Tax=Novosphingobium terrae TaxID=2726189 RepID=UPI0019822D59|nr:acyltransferase [Novosphingobium terrae]